MTNARATLAFAISTSLSCAYDFDAGFSGATGAGGASSAPGAATSSSASGTGGSMTGGSGGSGATSSTNASSSGAAGAPVDGGCDCSNGVPDCGETDADCGGPCPPCALGQICEMDADCASGHCQKVVMAGYPKTCIP
jgi:hypothetical protein